MDHQPAVPFTPGQLFLTTALATVILVSLYHLTSWRDARASQVMECHTAKWEEWESIRGTVPPEDVDLQWWRECAEATR